jgi:hypothetical protein
MKKSKLVASVLFLVSLVLPSVVHADVNIPLGYVTSVSFYWEADYDDVFTIVNTDTNQIVADVMFLNNNYYNNMVYDSDDYYCAGVSVDSYCAQPYGYSGNAVVTGLPAGNYALKSHVSQSDPYEYVSVN